MKFFKFYFTALLVFIFVTIFWQQKKSVNMNWKLINFDIIEGETPYSSWSPNPIGKYSFNEIIILDNNESFIFIGDNKEGNTLNIENGDVYDYHEKSEAVIFTSFDGGESLSKQILGKGSLKEGVYIDKTIFLVKSIIKRDEDIYQFIKYNLKSNKWEVIKEFKDEKIYGINFYSTSIGIANIYSTKINSHSERKVKSIYTIDGGKTWEEINKDSFFPTDDNQCHFVSAKEITYIEGNRLVKLNFITGEKETLKEEVASKGFKLENFCKGKSHICSENFLLKDLSNSSIYTFIGNKEKSDELYVKFLKTDEIVKLPNNTYKITVFGDYFHALIKDGSYFNYVWSEDRGKTWQIEKLRDFFIIPANRTYFEKGNVYAFAITLKGKREERGGRFVIRH